jgi:NADH-quinone oxidoreductase subunit M
MTMGALLASLIFVPLLAAAGVVIAPAARARSIAMVGTLLALALGVVALSLYPWEASGRMNLEARWDWLPQVGMSFSVGADSVSMLLIALTLLLGPICVAASATAITERLKTYYGWLLVLQAAMTGVFMARDLILFYICFEFTLVPMFVLISLYGSTNRRKAAIKFFLFTFTGSMIALAGLVYVAYVHATRSPLAPGAVREWSFDIETLQQAARLLTGKEQAWVLLALMAGFAVKVPLFPVHTWLPLAHTEAPTAGSVILAGVLLKLGTYGIYRFVLPFAPAAVVEYAPVIAVLSIIGIIYAGLICWVQTDVKKLVAYSSVAHLGFCVLGLVALNHTGISGAVLYMINHGLSTGALFLMIGMIYERYHTRSMKELGGLASKMPVWATFMVFFTMASVGLPGLNGFVSEFLCLIGTFQASSAWGSATSLTSEGRLDSGLWGSAGVAVPGATGGTLGPWFAAIAATGMIVAAMDLLYMVGRVVWGPLVEPKGHAHHAAGGGPEDSHEAHLPRDLTGREIGVLLPLAALCLALGVYPKPVLQVIQSPISNTIAAVNSGRAMAAAASPTPTAAGPTHRLSESGEEGPR